MTKLAQARPQRSFCLARKYSDTLPMEFLADMIREILTEDENGIIPLVPNT